MYVSRYSIGRAGTRALARCIKQQTCQSSRHKPELENIPFRKDFSKESSDLRRKWVECFTGARLDSIGRWWSDDPDPSILQGNIELPIGAITMPMAVGGPLIINGQHAKGEFLLPVATTEGALIASMNRGVKAINLSGGVNAFATQQRVIRAPVFKCRNAGEAVTLGRWASSQVAAIQEEVVSKHSRFAKLVDITPVYDSQYVHLMFIYETGDAAGQNIVTVCTWNALPWIQEHINQSGEGIEIKKYWIDGNLSGDKKCSNFSSVLGRGIAVSASVTIPETILNTVMKTSSESIYEFYRMVSRMGERSNTLGFHAGVANVLAAVFTTTGQDVGCVHESSVAKDEIILNNGPEKGIVFSIYMPSLILGTVGGGTHLPTQKESLEIIGCNGAGKIRKFAEIIASFCIAMDLSTMCAIDSGDFCKAHEALGRKKHLPSS